MTKQRQDPLRAGETLRCRWCRHALVAAAGPGRPRQFCSQKCRQWDWVARQRATELKLSEDEFIMAREELDALKDKIYVLHCAVQDVKSDLESPRPTREALTEMLQWILEAAEPVTRSSLAPSIRS